MKIEKTKPKKGVSEVPVVTKEMISKLLLCSSEELVEVLKSVIVWRFGKCELYHWVDVLDRFDLILDEAARQQKDEHKKSDVKKEEDTSCIFLCPKLDDPKFKNKVVTILNFTALLIEHSYARHIYNSIEHLCVLLASPDLDVVLAVLNLLYVFSKRSNFISRLAPKKRADLNFYLEYLGESWGGKQNRFGLAQCCTNAKKTAFPESCTTVYFEYQPEEKPQETQMIVIPHQGTVTESITLHNVDQLQETIPQLMTQLTTNRHIPQVNQMQLLTRLRLAKNFPSPVQRRKCVMARLQAISILVYSVGPPEIVDPLIYNGLVEELVEVLEIKGTDIMEIKAAVLRTLTAIIHLERDPRLAAIIEATGAAAYHGFLPSMVRDCVAMFTSTDNPAILEESEFPLSFATALFSFLYHLATYEASGDALVTSGIMESLLAVLEWRAFEPMNITLVTRAVRVIDLITGLDMSAFHSQGGWNKMLDRLEQEVGYCAKEAPGILPSELKPSKKPLPSSSAGSDVEGGAAGSGSCDQTDEDLLLVRYEETPMEMSSNEVDQTLKGEDEALEREGKEEGKGLVVSDVGGNLMCMPERAALIKSILNFLKKAIPEPTFTENIRTFVDSSLPRSLMHIISNAEYYGPSIYLPATEVTTVFIFHEPSQLSALQDNGLPGIVLNSIISKQIPVTREVLSSLPNILSAMCLNARGLQEFVAAEPFNHLFSVLVSPNYLPAMRKKKGADTVGDTASNLGVAMDELMRHQPTLRVVVIKALIRLLERLIEMGSEVLSESHVLTGEGQTVTVSSSSTCLASEAVAPDSNPSEEVHRVSLTATPSQEDRMDFESDNEGDDTDSEDEGSTEGDGEDGKVLSSERPAETSSMDDNSTEKSPPPLTEYIVNVVHFLDAILSNNSTDDHMREFINQGGMKPLLNLLSLPVLPLDFPSSAACTAITGACRSIMHISHAPELLTESLSQLSSLLSDLTSFLNSPQNASNSVLLQEIGPLSNMSEAIKSPKVTPVLHKLVAVNSFIQLFVTLSRSSQAGYNIESRLLCITHWASSSGRTVLNQLSQLYRALVWEGFILLAVAAGEDNKELDSVSMPSVKSESQNSEPQNIAATSGTSVDMEVDETQVVTVCPGEPTPMEGNSTTSPPHDGTQSSSDTYDCNSTSVVTPNFVLSPPSATGDLSNDPSSLSTAEISPDPAASSETPPPSYDQLSQHPSILVESLKQLTPLLTIMSRVGRSLAELMSLLIRLSTSPLHRTHRRGPGHALIMHGYQEPAKESIDVCMEVTNLLVDSLRWEVPMPQACSSAMQSPIRDWLFAGMTFKMYAVDFCELLLYDEQKQSYHMMQHAFHKKNALDAFINTFHMALKIVSGPGDSGSVYGSCVDFLEAWLNLAEKLMNASAILESSHALPVPPTTQTGGKRLMFSPIFNPLAFVIQAQKAVFPCLMELWQSPQLSKLNPKVVELLIATIRHFYSNEKLIQSKLSEFFKSDSSAASKLPKASGSGSESGNRTSTSAASAPTNPPTDAPPPPPSHPSVNPLFLQQLMDMGFPQVHAEDALIACGNDLPSAMDWILTHPHAASNSAATAATNQGENDLSEEEQIMRAIALSLGQDIDPKLKEKEEAKKKEEEDKVQKLTEEKEREQREMKPLDKSLLDDFSNKLLPGCLKLASSISESVYRVCDMIVALSKRNGESWRNRSLATVHDGVLASVKELTSALEQSDSCSVPEKLRDSVSCQLLLLTLLMEDMPLSCAGIVCEDELLSAFINLLQLTQSKISSLATVVTPGSTPQVNSPPTPKWLAPLLLLLDVWEKTLLIARWTKPANKDCLVLWQWFDNTRWCSYSHDMCQAIEKAYQEEETSINVRGASGRQRFDSNRNVLFFGPMLQCNLESSSNRPVLRLEIPKSEAQDSSLSSVEDPFKTPQTLHNLRGDHAVTAIRSCTHLLSCPLDTDTLHSSLKLCLRLTRQPELAAIFAREGGPQALLSLTQKSAFRGFSSLVTLLYKHCLEEGPVLRQAMEGVIRSAVASPFYNNKELRPQSMSSRELYYIMRKLGPCACRNPELFLEVVCDTIRLCSEPPGPQVYTSTQRVPPTMVKCVTPPKLEYVPLTSIQTNLISLLLDHLCAEETLDSESKAGMHGRAKSPEAKFEEDREVPRAMQFGDSGRRGRVRRGSYRRQLDAGGYDDDDVNSEDMTVDAEETGSSRLVGGHMTSLTEDRDLDGTRNENCYNQPLMSKAAILRLLSELVEAYPSCARLISESSRKVKVHGQPAKDMTVLAFVFDHLLPASCGTSGKVPPIAKLSKTFIQCLAVSHPSPETISLLVTEFKHALTRALNLPESNSKHNRVRALTGLLSQISDYIMTVRGALNPSHFARLLIRKGFISDLARAVHNLNLSSSMLPGTVNSILKPLEVLTKIVNQVAAGGKKAEGDKPLHGDRRQGGEGTEHQPADPFRGTAEVDQASNQVSITVDHVVPSSDAGEGGNDSGSLPVTGQSEQTENMESQTASGRAGVSESAASLEAIHESLIPLEEEEESERVTEHRSNLIDQVVNLARDLGRSHRLRGEVAELLDQSEEDMDTEDIVVVLDGAGADNPNVSMSDEPLAFVPHGPQPTQDDSEEGAESDEEDVTDDEDDDIIDEDRYNSAGEEVDEDEFEESHLEGGDHDDVGSDLSDTDSSAQDEDEDSTTEVEGSEERGGVADGGVLGSGYESDESLYATPPPNLPVNPTASGVGEPPPDPPLAVGGGGDPELEAEEDEDEDEDEDEEVEEDELDLEYSYDDEEEEMADYLHVDMPWSLRDPDLDMHIHGGLSSFFSRAYHTRPTQSTVTELEQHSATARTLPQYHPLLVRHVDHPQQVTSRAVGGPSVHVEPTPTRSSSGTLPVSGARSQGGVTVGGAGADPHHHESAMQQLLSDISAAAGTNEVLGFGVGSVNTQRNRGTHGTQIQSMDNGLESTHIPSIYSRWQEESTSLDGNAPHLCMRVLRETIINRLTEIYKKENSSKDATVAKTKTSQTGTTTGPPSTSAESSALLPTVQQSREGVGTVPQAPHPSDQVTPSSRSPRDSGTSSVDQLRSSLIQVADALAQTVAAVRTTREQLLGGREGEEIVAEIETGERSGEEEEMETREGGEESEAQSGALVQGRRVVAGGDSQLPVLPVDNQLQSTQISSAAVSVTSNINTTTTTSPSSTLALLSTFDGSQESAAATLATTDPDDPFHTFLSAIVGAPAPPFPGSNSTLSSTSQPPQQATVTSSVTTFSPRLPVFSQLHHSGSDSTQYENSPISIPMSVIQDVRTSGRNVPAESSTVSQTSESQTNSSIRSISSASSDLASQVSYFFSQNRNPQPQNQEVVDARTSSLAEELARVVSRLIPAPSSSSSAGSQLQPNAMASVRTSSGELASIQSPSPSDMLAPLLMSSLHMPASNGSLVVGQNTEGSTESTSAISTDQHRTPQLQASVLDQQTGQHFPPLTGAQAPPVSYILPPLLSNVPSLSSLSCLETVHHDHQLLHSNNSTVPVSSIPSVIPPISSDVPGDSVSATSNMLIPSTAGSDIHSVSVPCQDMVSSVFNDTPTSGLFSVVPTTSGLSSLVPTTSGISSIVFTSSGISSLAPTTSGISSVMSTTSGLFSVVPTTSGLSSVIPPTSEPSVVPSTTTQASAAATPTLTPIDPTFLAALPDSIRQEVMAQHEREQRLLRAQREASFMSSISPEFLAALPPNIQEEVLQQERLERARQNATSLASGDTIDNASFLHNLPSDLRRAILADMDDSLISHLPEDIMTEARTLRQERDNRRRQIMEQRHAFLERMMEEAHIRSSQSGGDGTILPPPSWPQINSQGMRYAVVNLNPNMMDGTVLGGMQSGGLSRGPLLTYGFKGGDQNSKQMLDQEALTCLLVLLFLDQAKLHNNRLHRIIKNLSQHSPTRAWILSSLLAIIREMRRTHPTIATPPPIQISSTCPMPPPLIQGEVDRGTSGNDNNTTCSSVTVTSGSSTDVVASTPVIVTPHHYTIPHWLDVSINAALGSHAKIFQFDSEHSGKATSSNKIKIHPLAGTAICHNVFDLLIFLGRSFGCSFLPRDLLVKEKAEEKKDEANNIISNFWQILLKLDGAVGRKGKGSLKGFKYVENKGLLTDQELFSNSIIGQLMELFTHDIIADNTSLTDKLMKLLSIVSCSIPRSGLKSIEKDPKATDLSPKSSPQITEPAAPFKAPFKNPADLETVFDRKEPGIRLSIVVPPLLGNIISVLTSGRCSEEGLEEATTLLTNLSKCSIPTREQILFMLLNGVRTIGRTLCSQIIALDESVNAKINEQALKCMHEQDSKKDRSLAQVGGNLMTGIVLPTATPEEQQIDHSHDLHIPSMEPLTCKGSQQSFFVRMLKVVCQLRESAQQAITAANKATPTDAVSTTQDSQERDSTRMELQTAEMARSSDVQASSATSQSRNDPLEGASTQHKPEATMMSVPDDKPVFLQTLSQQLELEDLWSILSNCLDALSHTEDPHAVFVLQPTVEAFFLVHANYKDNSLSSGKKQAQGSTRSQFGRLSLSHVSNESESNPASPALFSPLPGTPGPGEFDIDPFAHLPLDTAKFLKFAEKHRTVLNQILRQSTIPLAEGPFAVLVNYTKHLDFDVKRRHLRHELERMDEGLRREDIVLHLRRDHVFEDSFREFRRPSEELKGNLYIQFEGEEGQDVGGLLREWYLIIAREMFNPNYALFQLTPGDRVTYIPNPSSQINPNHLDYFRFIGKVIAKAIYDNKLLDCYFTRSFYKHILGKQLHYTDMEAEDYSFYQGMVFLLEHDLNEIGMELSFSIEMEEFGKTVTKDLKPNGQNIPVTEANKREYVQRACNMKMRESIKAQIDSFLKGFYEIIPRNLISIFNEQELELLISGLPTIDIDDLKANSEYHKYSENSLQIVWFWRALRSFDQADRANFLQFVTGTSKVPLTGFAALEGMNGVQKFQIHRDDRSTDRLPCAHTCFNQLDLPPYETYDKLRQMLLTACRECPEGFGFA